MAKRSRSRSSSPSVAAGRPTGTALRLGLTLLAPGALLLLPSIGLPGVDTSALPPAASNAALGAFGLGLLPFFSAAAIVELVAAVVPRWSALRLNGPTGRARLARATAILGVFLAACQAYGIAALISSPSLAAVVGPVSAWNVALTLVAGSSCLVLLASIAGDRALAGGFALLAVVTPMTTLGSAVARRFDHWSTSTRIILVLEIASVTAATVLVLRRSRAPARARAAGAAAASDAYQAPTASAAPRVAIAAPASGIAPLVITSALLAIPAQLDKTSELMARLADGLETDVVLVPVAATLLAVFTVGLAWLFNQPARVAALHAYADSTDAERDELLVEARAALGAAIARTLFFVGTLFFVERVALRVGGAALAPVQIVLIVALASDVVTELRARRVTPDLVAVWPEHRPYAIAVAREALLDAGIPLHARDEGQRRMLQFFASYIPIELMVPRAEAKRATQILAELLPLRAGAARPRTATRTAWALLGGLAAALAIVAVALAVFLAVLRSPRSPARAPSRPRADTLAIVALDDEVSLDPSAAHPLPAGGSFQSEKAPTGPGFEVTHDYVRLVRGEGESMDQARARLDAWLSRLSLSAAADRAIIGRVSEIHDDGDEPPTSEEIGWRTYIAKGPAVITGNDVESARAETDAEGLNAHVSINLSRAAGARFATFTRENRQRRIAIVVHGEVTSTSVMKEEISGGRAQIAMGSGPIEAQLAQAKDLAAKLRGD
jgi:hypothetical protein